MYYQYDKQKRLSPEFLYYFTVYPSNVVKSLISKKGQQQFFNFQTVGSEQIYTLPRALNNQATALIELQSRTHKLSEQYNFKN